MRFAWKAKGTNKNNFFNDNKYNIITREYLKCFETFYLITLLDVIDKLENHHLSIIAYMKHLQEFSNYINYHKKIDIIKKKNKKINTEIAKIEDEFVDLLNDIKDMNLRLMEYDKAKESKDDE